MADGEFPSIPNLPKPKIDKSRRGIQIHRGTNSRSSDTLGLSPRLFSKILGVAGSMVISISGVVVLFVLVVLFMA